MPRFRILTGDCLPLLRAMEPGSVDAVVTDPPYGLSFMGKRWDHDVPSVEVWAECLRVLKPGGHLLAFAGTRTQHRMACRIEDAGFEIRDMLAWVYGSGFPKSLDVGKAIDKAAGMEREVVGLKPNSFGRTPGGGDGWGEAIEGGSSSAHVFHITAPATAAAKQWDGWHTALKPSLEPITLARKPLIGTVAANVLTHGTGALNIDGCRVGTTVETWPSSRSYHAARGPKPRGAHGSGDGDTIGTGDAPPGRFPANLIHDGSDEVVGMFPDVESGVAVKRNLDGRTYNAHQNWGLKAVPKADVGYGDSGSAARFFYCAKASGADRGATNNHATVKPTDLMRYLCRLVTPPGGVVLDPFAGSGSTGRGAVMEGFHFIGCELDPEYAALAEKRIAEAMEEVALIAQTDPEPENPSLFD